MKFLPALHCWMIWNEAFVGFFKAAWFSICKCCISKDSHPAHSSLKHRWPEGVSGHVPKALKENVLCMIIAWFLTMTNMCSACDPSHESYTQVEQWAAVQAPRQQLGIKCVVEGHQDKRAWQRIKPVTFRFHVSYHCWTAALNLCLKRAVLRRIALFNTVFHQR